MTPEQTWLALIFGGRSSEHDVSIVSARSVARALDPDRYVVVPMAIDRSGLWADPETARDVLSSSGDRPDKVIRFTGSRRLDPRLLDGSIDAAFPVLHGPFGEDGTIQGMLEMLDLPYVGCDVTSSAACMDKGLAKRLLREAGLATAPWVELTGHGWTEDPQSLRDQCLELGLPLFVKPARLGSSVGITKVNNQDQLDAAIEKALTHDDRALAENGVDAREIELSVLGRDRPRASLPGEIVPGHEFYDYDDKYIDDSCQLLMPAPLSDTQSEEARDLAVRAYTVLGCDGMARVDLFLERSTEKFWVNELNTIPGFTSISMYPKLWELSGLPYSDLLDELFRLAVERHNHK
jgi:D-alanine-D-alanine ligase